MKMKISRETTDSEKVFQEVRLQEYIILHVEDNSLPAEQILNTHDEPHTQLGLFVP